MIGYGFYGPHAGPYGVYPPCSDAGTAKIGSKTTDAEVFVNGSYAGTVKDNKTMHVSQGTTTSKFVMPDKRRSLRVYT